MTGGHDPAGSATNLAASVTGPVAGAPGPADGVAHDLPTLRDWVNDNPLLQVLHARCDVIEQGHARFLLDPPDHWRNPNGAIPGAAVLAVADYAAGMATVSVTTVADYVATIDLGLHFIEAAIATPLVIGCHVLRAGTRLVVLRTEVHDTDGVLVAAGQATFSVARGAGADHPIGHRPGPP